MNAVKNQIAELVSVELERAKEEHEDFHSLHEGYAVLLEEIDESRDELQIVQADAAALWRCVKDDNALCAKLVLVEIEKAAVHLAAEAIQVAAMARKAVACCLQPATSGTLASEGCAFAAGPRFAGSGALKAKETATDLIEAENP